MIFVTSGDMPLFDSEIIKKIVGLVNEENVWTSVLVRKTFLLSLGLEAEFFVNYNNEECAYTGISIIDPRRIQKMEAIKESYVVLRSEERRVGKEDLSR